MEGENKYDVPSSEVLKILNENGVMFPIPMEARTEFLHSALVVERVTSMLLGIHLKIDDSTSISFGNTGSALSFNQKINLLIDVEALDKTTKSKYLTFMEIRNQFAHNYEASTYEKCLSYLPGREQFLVKIYKSLKNGNVEENLTYLVSQLKIDVLKTTYGCIDKVKLNYQQETNGEMNKKKLELIIEGINRVEMAMRAKLVAAMAENRTYSANEVKTLWNEIFEMLPKVNVQDYELHFPDFLKGQQ